MWTPKQRGVRRILRVCKEWARVSAVNTHLQNSARNATWENIVLFQKLDAHPLKKTWEFKKFYPYFSLGIFKKLSTFLVAKVKKTWEFSKFLIVFGTKYGIPDVLLFLTEKIGNFHFFFFYNF